MNHLPPAGVVQLSRERTKGCQGREGSSCWRWAQGQAWDNRAEDLRGGPDRWSFVSGVPLSGGAAKQISPQPSFLSCGLHLANFQPLTP